MKKTIQLLITFIITCGAIVFICNIPRLFNFDRSERIVKLDTSMYIQAVGETFQALSHPASMTYLTDRMKELPLFSRLFEAYLYSFELVMIAFFIAIVCACFLGYLFMVSSKLIRKIIYQLLNILDAIPDVMVIVVIQVIAISIFQKTEWMLFDIYSFGEDDRIYFFPIFCLTILPFAQLSKYLIFILRDEVEESYVEFARAKGLSVNRVIIIHVFRNVLLQLHGHARTIFLFMISNLLVMDLLMNLGGMMNFLYSYAKSMQGFSIGMIMLYIPFFLLFQLGELFVSRFRREEM